MSYFAKLLGEPKYGVVLGTSRLSSSTGDVNSGRQILGGLLDESGSTMTPADVLGGVSTAVGFDTGDGVVDVTGCNSARATGGNVGAADPGFNMTGGCWGTGAVDVAGGTGDSFRASKGRTAAGVLVADAMGGRCTTQ